MKLFAQTSFFLNSVYYIYRLWIGMGIFCCMKKKCWRFYFSKIWKVEFQSIFPVKRQQKKLEINFLIFNFSSKGASTYYVIGQGGRGVSEIVTLLNKLTVEVYATFVYFGQVQGSSASPAGRVVDRDGWLFKTASPTGAIINANSGLPRLFVNNYGQNISQIAKVVRQALYPPSQGEAQVPWPSQISIRGWVIKEQ